MTDDKKKVLDVTFPKEDQEKNAELMKMIGGKKYQVKILTKENKERFMYLNDPADAEPLCKLLGVTILKVRKL